MSSQPAPAEPQDAPAQQAEDTQYYRTILHELIDMGTDLARRVHQQASQPAPTPGTEPTPNPAPDPTQAFDRIARVIRRTIVLARSLAEPAPPRAAANPGHRTAARKRIIREVEDAIQRRPPGTATDADPLHAELRDRLDAPDLDDDISHRPIADIIADICRDLGIAAQPGPQPWKRRTPYDIEALCARAAQTAREPRSPASAPHPPGSPTAYNQPGTDPPDVSRSDPPRPGPTLVHRTKPFHGP